MKLHEVRHVVVPHAGCPCCMAWQADRDAWRERAQIAEAELVGLREVVRVQSEQAEGAK